MSCPNKFISKKADIEVKDTVKNQNFFANRTVDKWTFLEFLIYKEQNALRRLKTMLLEYNNSISSLIRKHKNQMDPDLLGYLAKLKDKAFSNEDLKDLAQELAERNKESISIVNSTISSSNLIVGSGSGSISINQQGKRKQENDSDIILVKRKKDHFALLKPITPSISHHFNSPGFDQDSRATVIPVAFVKLDENDMCDNEAVNNEYASNMKDSGSNKYISQYPVPKAFLSNALDQQLEDLLPWMGQHGFDEAYSDETKKAILMIRLTLTDFYANCLKPSLTNPLNERTPFVEYVVPIFKYYSAIYKDLTFQWCEKGLETNKCIAHYKADGQAKRRLADGVGYVVIGNTEQLLFESSGEENDGHTEDVTIKLLECSIRALKMEMESVKDASFETFKKRRFYTYLYASDRLTMLSTFAVTQEKWGYTMVREASIPRTWSTRARWLKVMDLIFYTKAMLDEQKTVAISLESEHNGWTEVIQGTSIKCLSKL